MLSYPTSDDDKDQNLPRNPVERREKKNISLKKDYIVIFSFLF